MFSALVTALFCPNISDAIFVEGALSTPLICYGFPGIFYLYIAKGRNISPKKLFAWVIIIISVIVGIVGFATFVLGKIDVI